MDAAGIGARNNGDLWTRGVGVRRGGQDDGHRIAGISEIRAGEVGTREVGIAQLGTGEIESGHVGAVEICHWSE